MRRREEAPAHSATRLWRDTCRPSRCGGDGRAVGEWGSALSGLEADSLAARAGRLRPDVRGSDAAWLPASCAVPSASSVTYTAPCPHPSPYPRTPSRIRLSRSHPLSRRRPLLACITTTPPSHDHSNLNRTPTLTLYTSRTLSVSLWTSARPNRHQTLWLHTLVHGGATNAPRSTRPSWRRPRAPTRQACATRSRAART